jgi:hypothetical protein
MVSVKKAHGKPCPKPAIPCRSKKGISYPFPQAETSGARIAELGHERWAIKAFWLMVLLALNSFRAFYIFYLQPVFRDRHTQVYIASQIAACSCFRRVFSMNRSAVRNLCVRPVKLDR